MATDDETGDVRLSAAAVLRMNATVLEAQGKIALKGAESLREQADRIEHGREPEMPDLGPEEPDERELPELRRLPDGIWRTNVDASGATHEEFVYEPPQWVRQWLLEFHPIITGDSRFVRAYNALAMGNPPSWDLAHAVAQLVRNWRESEPS